MPSSDETKQPCPPPFPLVSPPLITCRQGTCSPEDKNNSSNTSTGGEPVSSVRRIEEVLPHLREAKTNSLLFRIEFTKVNNRHFGALSADIDTAIPIDRYL